MLLDVHQNMTHPMINGKKKCLLRKWKISIFISFLIFFRYAAARKLGILQVIPRVEGISTSELRKRTADSVSRESAKMKHED